MPQPAQTAKLTRTPGIETYEDLANRIGYMRSLADSMGRDRPDVCFVPFGMRMTDTPDHETFARLGDEVATYTDIGVDWLSVPFSGTDRDSLLESIEVFGKSVIDR
jgi:hypothetical protein